MDTRIPRSYEIAHIELELWAPSNLHTQMQAAYEGFGVTRSPRGCTWRLDVSASSEITPWLDSALPILNWQPPHFCLTQPDLYHCEADLDARRAHVHYQRRPNDGRLGLAPAGIRGVMKNLWAVLLPQRHGLLLHASAVHIEGGAVAFVGKSGAGKSTTCATFGTEAILNDELIAISDTTTQPQVHATPFSGALDSPRRRRAYPLRAAFKIVQSKEPQVQAIAPSEALRLLAQCAAMPAGSSDSDRELFEVATLLAQNVPWFRLEIPKDEKVVQRLVRSTLHSLRANASPSNGQ